MEVCVYVVESDDKQREELIKEVSNGRFIRVVGEESDGERAYREIALLKPDVVITGLVLPTMDGFALIEKLKRFMPKIDIVVVSAISGKGFIQKAMEMGASYYMVHPINSQSLIDAVMSANSEKPNFKLMQTDVSAKNIEERLSNIFYSIGIPAHIKGYQFLREAIKLAIEKPDVINSITKVLYPSIADSYQTTPSKVERAIRHAIEVAWNKGRIENINNLFGVKIYTANDKPTNGEFIALIADKMLIENM